MSLLSPPLQAFMSIARHQTVMAAARELGITQTGVTQRIRSLEAQLSATLFVRSRRGMGLTHEGEALLRYCQGASDLEGQALAQISGAGLQTEVGVRISGPSSLMRSRVIPNCSDLLKSFKNLLIEFHLSDVPDLTPELRSGKSQMIIVAPEHVAREMDSRLLKPEKYLLVATRDWSHRTTRDIVQNERIIDFDPADPMSFNTLRHFGLFDLARKTRLFVNNTEAIAQLFCEGLGYGVLTSEFAEPFLKKGQLFALNQGKAFENRLALAWYPRKSLRKPSADYFESMLKAIR